MMVQVNPYRTNTGARSAERRSVGEMIEIAPSQMWRKHAADGTRIGCSISVPAHVAEHGTDVKACAAADAVQYLALFLMRQQRATAVVHQHNMEFFRTVGFARTARTADQGPVGCDRLSGSGGGQHRPERGQVFEARNDLLN